MVEVGIISHYVCVVVHGLWHIINIFRSICISIKSKSHMGDLRC